MTETAIEQDVKPEVKKELSDKEHPHSFQNIFARVIECTRRHKVTEKEIFRLIPMQISSFYSHSRFSESYEDSVQGSPPEGIMSAKVATAILEAIKVVDDRQPPAKPTRKKREKPAAEGAATGEKLVEVESTAGLAPLFVSLVTAKDVKPEAPIVEVVAEHKAEESPSAPRERKGREEELFDMDQIRGRLGEIFHDVGLAPYEVYRHLKAEYRSPQNLFTIQGWFDGTVRMSPKDLVAAFFQATLKALEVSKKELCGEKLAALAKESPALQ